jgi:hypothetical protein
MSFALLIDALRIPPGALVQQRVPKKLLLEQGAPTAADKRGIQDGIEELFWVAALKPTNIGVPAFHDDVREYLEIAILTAELRPAAKAVRLIELIHRAIPYPLVLLTRQGEAMALSLAHKRWSQGEKGKVVVEDVRHVPIAPTGATGADSGFLASLAISGLPARDLFTFYDGLVSRLTAFEAARITGSFRSPESGAAVRDSLDRHGRLKRELANLRAKAHKERQLNRRVELNLEIKRLEAELAAAEKAL